MMDAWNEMCVIHVAKGFASSSSSSSSGGGGSSSNGSNTPILRFYITSAWLSVPEELDAMPAY